MPNRPAALVIAHLTVFSTILVFVPSIAYCPGFCQSNAKTKQKCNIFAAWPGLNEIACIPSRSTLHSCP